MNGEYSMKVGLLAGWGRYPQVVAEALREQGYQVYCLGTPRVGQEVADAPASSIIGTAHIRDLLSRPGIHDVVPIGSRGILAEASHLARHTGSR